MSFSDYLSPLFGKFNDRRVKNIEELTSKIVANCSLGVYAMAKDKKQYDVFKALLNGSQCNTLSDAIIIKEVQEKAFQELLGATIIYILSDPCDIRKPSAPKMESIGKVMSLGKQVVNGYKAFNTVAVNMNKQVVNLLSLHSMDLKSN